MNWVAIIIISVLMAAVAYLFLRLSAQRKVLIQLREEQRTLAEAWRSEQADLSQFIRSKQNPFITIEILNAVELAKKASIVGGLIGKCAPDFMQRTVIKRTADSMRNQMTEHGVQVEIEVHGIN